MSEESIIDLTQVDKVKQRAGVQSNAEDGEIQDCITAFSQYFLNKTGRDNLNTIVAYSEIYDGKGQTRLFLRNYPIISLTSVIIDGVTMPLSTGYGIGGVVVTNNGKAISFRSGTGGFNTLPYYPNSLSLYRFSEGVANVSVSYRAGYGETPADLEMAVREAVAINYKRKQWLDQKSKSISAQGGTGTTSYQDWALPPMVERVLLLYSRKTF